MRERGGGGGYGGGGAMGARNYLQSTDTPQIIQLHRKLCFFCFLIVSPLFVVVLGDPGKAGGGGGWGGGGGDLLAIFGEQTHEPYRYIGNGVIIGTRNTIHNEVLLHRNFCKHRCHNRSLYR